MLQCRQTVTELGLFAVTRVLISGDSKPRLSVCQMEVIINIEVLEWLVMNLSLKILGSLMLQKAVYCPVRALGLLAEIS